MGTLLFRHGWSQMSPWEDRPDPFSGQDLPISSDCANVWDGKGVVRLRDNPLRCGMIWVPPEVFTVTYGIVRASLKFPAPLGGHSCLWLQSVTPYATPADHEVDIAENFGRNNIQQTVHWKDGAGAQQETKGTGVGDAGQWKTYEVEIRPTGYIFRINGAETFRTKVAAPDRPKTLIFSFLSDEWERAALDLSGMDQMKAYMDWVEVWS